MPPPRDFLIFEGFATDVANVLGIRREEGGWKWVVRAVTPNGMGTEEFTVEPSKQCTFEELGSTKTAWGMNHRPVRVGPNEFVAQRTVAGAGVIGNKTVRVSLREPGPSPRVVLFTSSTPQIDMETIIAEVCAKSRDAVVVF